MKYWNKLCLIACVLLFFLIQDRNYVGPFIGSAAGDTLRNFLGVLAQISATMLGFLLAALAILASISGHRLIRNMQRTGHFRLLLTKAFINVGTYGLAAALALLAYLTKTHIGVMSNIAIISFLYASLVLIDVGWRFWLVLTHLNPD